MQRADSLTEGPEPFQESGPSARLERAADRRVRLQSVEVALDLCTGPTRALLNLADEHIVVALDLVEVIVRQLAPLTLDFSSNLPPLASEFILVHRITPPSKKSLSPYGNAFSPYVPPSNHSRVGLACACLWMQVARFEGRPRGVTTLRRQTFRKVVHS